MSQLDVKILHQDYVLTCPDGKEAQLLEAVDRVDNQFEAMRNSSKLRSRERIGVLLSVNLAFENLELRQQLQSLQQQLAQRSDWQTDELPLPEPAETAALQAQIQQDAAVAAALLARVEAALASAPVTHDLFSTAAPEQPPTHDLADTAQPSTLGEIGLFDSGDGEKLSTAAPQAL